MLFKIIFTEQNKLAKYLRSTQGISVRGQEA